MIEKTINSKTTYTCSFMSVIEDDVMLDNGKTTQRVVIKHPGGAAVLPITRDHKVILTKQFRYPIKAVTIEIPAGKKDDIHESSLICAKRELEEETGYVSDDFIHLFGLHPCLGYSDELLDIYVARNCYEVLNPKPQDEDENITVLIVGKEEVKQLLNDKAITDGKTLVALHHYLMNE